MRTITEYRPMIFALMMAHGEERIGRNLALRKDLKIASAYIVAASLLMFNLRVTPLDCEFWIVFAPAYVATELALMEVLRCFPKGAGAEVVQNEP